MTPHEGQASNRADGNNVGGSVAQFNNARDVYIDSTRPSPPRTPLDDAADKLATALRKQWQHEEDRRKVPNPGPLTIRWDLAPDALTDHAENIWGVPAEAVPDPLPLAGELSQILDVYERIPSGRLAVLGRSGSGKSVLAMRFALEMLGPPGTSVGVVPVIFGLGSWDPVTPLRDWLVGALERDHSGLRAATPDGPTLAAALVDGRRVLPVLDGFDEIAGHLHGPALKALSSDLGPLLLTSRPLEYAAAVTEAGALTSTAGIQLQDLRLKDLEAYLPRTARKKPSGEPGGGPDGKPLGTIAPTPWTPVLRTLRENPDAPAAARLAAVLTTPLMVMLARTVYGKETNRDPQDLLDADRFSTPEALEDHLLDEFVPTVYQDAPGVQRWLGYLARLGTDDLAWWKLGSSLGRSSRAWVIGLAAGLVVGLADALAAGFMFAVILHTHSPVEAVWIGLLNGTAFGSASGLVFGLVYRFRHGDKACEPSRQSIRILSRTRDDRERRTLRSVVAKPSLGLAGGFVFGFLSWPLAMLLLGANEGFEYGGFMNYVESGLWAGFNAGILYGVSAALVFTLMTWFEALVRIETAVSPSALLSINRANVLFQLLVCVLLCGTLGGILYELEWFRVADWFVYVVVGGLGVGLAYGLGLTAWGHWLVLCRVWLPLTGRLPWRPSAFLRDAHDRGVLRQSGAYYQFRHARLRDRLARQGRYEGPPGAGARSADDHDPAGSITA
ncbi:hypothetical protein JIX56_18150 [Streptomyces sp. CA-210063]|uniref:hypothetical protein n=1 Tax=Streptomyces sp. CA-210063 TaxID=2801029 RepID=UPI00214B2402|nr:hypothetical protein [Streptomyces sp. CA-210063]UUU31681.1 hypothetical protein JIX56_18150 [Streptomyces sp. CA-210063]